MTPSGGAKESRLTIGLPGGIVPPFASIAKNAQRSEAAGAEAIWFPDHLMGFWPRSLWTPDITPLAALQASPDVFFDPFIAMSVAMQATTRVKVGTAVTQPFSRHPAHLAQTMLTLSHQSAGRAVLGIGAGEAENLEPYGVPVDRPAARLAEALQLIRLLWSSSDSVSFDGEFWVLRDATLGLNPSAEAAAPPIWMAAHGPRMLRVVGQQADAWMPIKMPRADYEASLATIRGAAKSVGRPEEAITPAAWGFTVIHESEAEVERLLDHPLIKGVCLMFGAASYQRHGTEHPLGRGSSGFGDYIPSRLDRDSALEAVSRVPTAVVRDHLFVGTPDQILSELRDLQSAGLRHAVLWNITFLADPSLAGLSFRLLEELIQTI